MAEQEEIIEVRGTRFHSGKAAYQKNDLIPGTVAKLVHNPNNEYDRYAVEIRLANGTMIGHIPRERSFFISNVINSGRLNHCYIHSATLYDNQLDVLIEIAYEEKTPRQDMKIALSRNKSNDIIDNNDGSGCIGPILLIFVILLLFFLIT